MIFASCAFIASIFKFRQEKKDFNVKQRTLQNVTHCSKILRLARIRILKLVLDKDFVLAFSEGQVLQNYNITCKILIARL